MLVVVIEVVTVEKKAACLEDGNWGRHIVSYFLLTLILEQVVIFVTEEKLLWLDELNYQLIG